MNNDDDNEGSIVISIKDGYLPGDSLSFKEDNITYSWNEDTKELIVDSYDGDLKALVNNLILNGAGHHDRFVEISLKDNSDNNLSLAEISLYPVTAETSPYDLSMIMGTDEQIDVNVIYEENVGSNVIPSAYEQILPYSIDNGPSGVVYKLVKDSFIASNEIEIWGYNFQSDKIDLSAFQSDNKSSFNYDISRNNIDNNLHLSISSDNGDAYSIVFRETDSSLYDGNDVDNMIQSMIINTSLDIKT